MTEKNGMAQILDKIVEALGNLKPKENSDDLNKLPKPNLQDIGHGLIVWQWHVGDITVESALATNLINRLSLEKGEYSVTLKMPHALYSFDGDNARDLGKAILSAWNWKEVWKLHAGDFLLEELSQEPEEIDEPEQPEFDLKAMEPEIPAPLRVLAPKRFGDTETLNA